MGLDVCFFAESKADPRFHREVGYFGKVNFLLTYFGVEEDHNCSAIDITKDALEQLATDANYEIIAHNFDNTTEPTNEKFRTKRVFFGGSVEYDDFYWKDIEAVRDWANKAVREVDWDKDTLKLFPSW